MYSTFRAVTQPDHALLSQVSQDDPICTLTDWNALWENLRPGGLVMFDHSGGQWLPIGVIVTAPLVPDAIELRAPTPPSSLWSDLCRPEFQPSSRTLATANAGDGVPVFIAVLEVSGGHGPWAFGSLLHAYAHRCTGIRPSVYFGKLSEEARSHCVSNGFQLCTESGLTYATEESAVASGNAMLARLLGYCPPRLGFTSAQREILRLACEGYTDREIADRLEVNVDAVKKRWSGMYRRACQCFPDLLPKSPDSGRGQEKRRALLAHLRDRPEEMEPFEQSGF